MNRSLQYFNLFGVIALAAVCVVQWHINRELNLHTSQLEKDRLAQKVRINEQEKQIRGQAVDLDSFREHVQRAAADIKSAESNVAAARRDSLQLSAERDELKETLAKWSKAVEDRDVQLVRATEQIQRLGTDRNEAVGKFNDLAEKHNRLVEDLNERTLQYNSLVERLNTLAKSGSSSSK